MSRGRHRKIETRDALHGIMLAFWKNGYTATSMNDLVEASRMAKPGLYAAFGDKEGMFEKALEYYFQVYGGSVLAPVGAAEQHYVNDLRDLIAAIGHLSVDPSTPLGCFVFNSHVESAYGTDRHKILLADMCEVRRQALRTRLHKAVAAGELSEETDIDSLAIYIDGQLGAVSLLGRAGATKDQIDAFVETAVRALPTVIPVDFDETPVVTLQQ